MASNIEITLNAYACMTTNIHAYKELHEFVSLKAQNLRALGKDEKAKELNVAWKNIQNSAEKYNKRLKELIVLLEKKEGR